MAAHDLTFYDGTKIPVIGLGVYQSRPGKETFNAVLSALRAGYTHIDTAKIYGNEADVGAAIKASGIPREKLFITTKLWNSDQGYDSAVQACKSSLQKLGLSYLDLYLIHSPVQGKRLDSWRALETLKKEGLVRSIGVSNYGIHHLKELLGKCTIKPVTNQIEVHPYLNHQELADFCKSQGIVVSAYSPLAKAQKMNDPKLNEIARRYNRTPAQVMLRWGLQHQYVILPKSVRDERIKENMQVFDFQLSKDDMAKLDKFDEKLSTGWDPTTWE